MAQKLKVYLVNQFGTLGGAFDESRQTKCASILKGYFESIIKGVARYDSVEVTWKGKPSDPTAFDFVCYFETSTKGSIVAKKGPPKAQLGLSGSTAQATVDKTIISETYLRQIVQGGVERGNATPDCEKVVANCALHELAHNLLDADSSVAVVHKVKGGVILRDTDAKPLSASDSPNETDNQTIRNGFGKKPKGVVQYTGDMPTT